MVIGVGALNTTPTMWGSDSMTYRPCRWISTAEGSTDLAQEELNPMPVGYIPWGIGPRGCPGKKFAQVEFVATIAYLFRNNRVKAVAEPGETFADLRKRIYEVVEDSSLLVTVKMNHSEKVKLVWEKLS